MSHRTESAGSKYLCTVCDRKFSRIDHLKRHHLRHSGIKPYVCTFCSESFTRCDNLRQHYPYCNQRGNRLIPETSARGRRPHACDSESFPTLRCNKAFVANSSKQCTSMKLGCDGGSPCKTCRDKSLVCKKTRLQNKKESTVNYDSKLDEADESPSDRGSVKFLLNCGTASFIEDFKFPPADDPSRDFSGDVVIINDSTSPSTSNAFLDSGVIDYSFMTPLEGEPVEWSFFNDDMFMSFIGGPFGGSQIQTDDSLSSLTYHLDQISSPNTSIGMASGEEFESESILSASMIQSMLGKAYSLNLDEITIQEISHNLNFLLAPTNIPRFVKMYFDSWHPHCPIVHMPSFNLETVPIPLLVSIIFMGAVYSSEKQEVYAAKRLLDLAELYVYSVDGVNEEYEIRQTLRSTQASSPAESIATTSTALEHLQAAYLMVVVQYWAGSQTSKKRSKEVRFATVLKIARKLGYQRASHDLADSLDEISWIKKEAEIRTINMMALLDCAFAFFKNYPCRMPLSEMKFDLPCDESLFAVAHPFSEPHFRPSRHLSIFQAFQSLFEKQKIPDSVIQSSSQHNKQVKEAVTNTLNLNAMDMFLLIHLLYTYVYTHMPLLHSSAITPQSPSSTPSPLASTRAALSRWRSLWMIIRSQIPAQTWATMGFYRNAYNYWLVAQLLVSNRANMEVAMGMAVCCEDTLKQLSELLKDGTDDT